MRIEIKHFTDEEIQRPKRTTVIFRQDRQFVLVRHGGAHYRIPSDKSNEIRFSDKGREEH